MLNGQWSAKWKARMKYCFNILPATLLNHDQYMRIEDGAKYGSTPQLDVLGTDQVLFHLVPLARGQWGEFMFHIFHSISSFCRTFFSSRVCCRQPCSF